MGIDPVNVEVKLDSSENCRKQAGERPRRAFEPQFVSPPVAARNGLARLLQECTFLTHKFC